MNIILGSVVYDAKDDEYVVLEFLGNGNFGNVYKLKRKNDGEIFALKTLLASFTDDKDLKMFINEGNHATKVRGTHVITYYFFHDGKNSLLSHLILLWNMLMVAPSMMSSYARHLQHPCLVAKR